MSTKKRIPIHPNQPVSLPIEATEVLGNIKEAFLVIDPSTKTVIISATDPEIRENNAILDELAKLNQDLTVEEYGEPVPASFLNRRGKGNQKEK